MRPSPHCPTCSTSLVRNGSPKVLPSAICGPLPTGPSMKLHWSPRSPFVRKVMIVAHELGLTDRITCVRTVVATTRPHAALMEDNPLSKIPTLVLDDGTVLYNSPVICEYLDSLHAGRKLVPADGKERMTALRRQALGDGFLDFLLLLRNERERAASLAGPSRDLRHQETGRAQGARQGSRRSRRFALHRRPHRDRLRAVLSRFQVWRRGLAERPPRHRALASGLLRSAPRCAPRSRSMTVEHPQGGR